VGRSQVTSNQQIQQAIEEIHRVMVGQQTVVRHAFAACLAGGHVLFEDVPGTGKTTLASTMGHVLGIQYTRVQGTPDLLPSELVGTMVFRPDQGEFIFRAGPVFTQILLMDEINRATPRTQSALLEAMSEGQVTVDGVTRVLPQPFFVLATANPIESQGVFPLPEAQLDRFLVQLRLGYVTEAEEVEMVRRIRLREFPTVNAQLSAEMVEAAKHGVRGVHLKDELVSYIVRLCRVSRTHPEVALGASPRAVLALTAFSQALAYIDGRDYVLPDDVKEAWKPVMRHRIHLRSGWDPQDEGGSHYMDTLLEEILGTVIVPVELHSDELETASFESLQSEPDKPAATDS